MSGLRWTVVVPVKDAHQGKTRLAGHLDAATRVALVRAMAGDTLAAALAAEPVDRVVLVTGDDEVARAAVAAAGSSVGGAELTVLAEPGVRGPGPAGTEDRGSPSGADGAAGAAGLDAAVRAGVAHARALDPGHGVAVLLGDVPALRPADLAAALAQAAAHPRAVVPDADGTGTTLLTARPGVAPHPRFGAGSAGAHVAAGHVRLDLPGDSTVRQDVDVVLDLGAVGRLGPGPLTRVVLAGIGRPALR